MPTALETKLLKELGGDKSLRLDEFMQLALLDPEHGYYTNRKVFGVDGDFITAPDVSQIFGEVIAAYLTANIMGTKQPATVVEFGPGRGTLMNDMLRSFKSMPPELDIKEVILVEASKRLVKTQKETLADSHLPTRWVSSVEELPKEPCFIVANEFFDALPIRQFIQEGSEWKERVVTQKNNKLMFQAANEPLEDEAALKYIERVSKKPSLVTNEKILEYPEAGIATMRAMADHIAKYGGMLVAIDYGHAVHGFGDTLQAVKKHKFVDALSHIGEADITSHVNFALMQETAETAGLTTHLLEKQGIFLRSLGAELRAQALIEGLDKHGQIDVASGLERLIAPTQMGELFKVLVVAHSDMTVLKLF